MLLDEKILETVLHFKVNDFYKKKDKNWDDSKNHSIVTIEFKPALKFFKLIKLKNIKKYTFEMELQHFEFFENKTSLLGRSKECNELLEQLEKYFLSKLEEII